MEPTTLWQRCTDWAGIEIDPVRVELLERYRHWLSTEAVEAGGIGPNELDRIDNRHIGDSLLFAGGFERTPATVLDVGSGVGLPGIPLAIIMPDTHFTLLDRAGRRIDLMKRATRILELSNVEVVLGDVVDWDRPVDSIVSRASLAPEQALVDFRRILEPDGVAVVGGSWAGRPRVEGFEPLEVPATVLDQRVWLLIMRPSE